MKEDHTKINGEIKRSSQENKRFNTRIDSQTIPIWLIYTHKPFRSNPSSIWLSLKWTEVTSQSANLFLRVEGDRKCTIWTDTTEWCS